jgi:hypothetical protein
VDDVTRGVVIGAVAGGIPALLQTAREIAQAFRERRRAEAEADVARRREARDRRRQAYELFLRWLHEVDEEGLLKKRFSYEILAQLDEIRLYGGAPVMAAIDALRAEDERQHKAKPQDFTSLDLRPLLDAMRGDLGFGDAS